MESVVNERLFQFIKREVGSVRELATVLNMSEVTLGNKIRGDRKLDIELLVSILQSYPQLSADWVLLGKGEMLRSETQPSLPVGDDHWKIEMLQRGLEEEKERSNKYWDMIQKLLK